MGDPSLAGRREEKLGNEVKVWQMQHLQAWLAFDPILALNISAASSSKVELHVIQKQGPGFGRK